MDDDTVPVVHPERQLKRCLKGFCDCGGRVGGAGQESGLRLPAKMPKRLAVLKAILGPPPRAGYPEELLRAPGLVKDGGLGDVRYSKAHHDEAQLTVRTTKTQGKIRVHQPKGLAALPRRPLAEVKEAVAQQQQHAEPPRRADGDEDDEEPAAARPARGERAQQEALETLRAAVDAALEEIEELAEGTREALSARIDGLAASNEANFQAKRQAEEKVRLHQIAARAAHESAEEVLRLKRRVKLLERRVGPGVLSYDTFVTDRHLRKHVGDFLFLPTVAALDAHLAFMDACCPLDELVWIDTNGRVVDAADGERAAGGGAAARDADAQPTGEGDAQATHPHECFLSVSPQRTVL